MLGVIKTGFFYLLLFLFFSFSFSNTLLAQKPKDKIHDKEIKKNSIPYSNNPVVARVKGQPIHLDEIKNAQIHELMQRLYEMQNSLLKQKVVKSLSESHPELKSEGTPKITENDIETFYLEEPGIKDLGDLDQLRGQIRNYLEKMQSQSFFKDLEKQYQVAVEKGWVVDYFTPPKDFRLQAKVGSAMLWFTGKKAEGRKVFVMEYSDFLCPFCKKVQDTLRDLRSKYATSVQFGYRHFPIHQEARDLSEAVECARDQGRFWELQSLVYTDPRRYQESRDELLRNARRAGVRNLSAFEKCLDSGKYKERVQKDMEDGIALGIQGTPTFIIGAYDLSTATVNGEMFSGAVAPATFVDLIEKYLNPPQE